MFGMPVFVIGILSGIVWYCGFIFSGNVHFAFIKDKHNTYDSFVQMILMFFFWWLYLIIVTVGVLGTLFGRFLAFLEGK